MRQYKNLLIAGIFLLSITTAGWAADDSQRLIPGSPDLEGGAWFAEVLTPEVLARITGRGVTSDLPQDDLDRLVGTGFISYLTPEEIARIDTAKILSQEGRKLITGDLITMIDADNTMYVIDRENSPIPQTDVGSGASDIKTDLVRGPFAVQVGIFQDKTNALSLLKELKEKHYYQAYIFQTQEKATGKLFYAVRLGDYEGIKEPYIDAARFKTREDKPAVITYTNTLNAVPVDAWPEITLSATELAQMIGKGFATDMSDTELDKTVGKGIISNLTPEQLEKIDASGFLSAEAIRLKTRSLAKIIARGVTYMVDESKFTAAELEEIKGRGTTIKEIGRLPFSVQVGVYQVRENALSMLKELQSKGYEPYIFQTTDEAKKNLFAVRLGDYETIKGAYAEATHFKRKEHKPAIVTYINSLQAVKPKIPDDDADDDTLAGESPGPLFDSGKTYASEDLNKLYQEVLSLRQELDLLKEEAAAREKLRLTEAEERKEEKEILEAVGRDYVLAPKGTLSLDYSFGYSYNSADLIWTEGQTVSAEHTADHSINNTVSASYAWFDNLTITAAVPLSYKYKDTGGDDSKDVSDVGDVSVGARWQMFKQTGETPPVILNVSISAPTGRSPYEINPDKDLPTGSGTWQLSLGSAINKTFDPVVVYGSFGLTYVPAQTDLDYHHGTTTTLETVGASYGFGLGFGVGYAMSYKASLNASIGYSYAMGTTFEYSNGNEYKSNDTSSASLSVGMGWKLSTNRTISVGLGIGLTDATSDYTLSFRIPFDYEPGELF